MRVAAVVVQKNEVDCLRPWVMYHGYLLGMENIYILDNNSDNPIVLEMLEYFREIGITIHSVPADRPFEQRGSYTAEFIQSIEKRINYDFIFPMDCDEFLFTWNSQKKPSCNRFDFMNCLASLRGMPQTLMIRSGMENVNKSDKIMHDCTLKKAFFTSNNCLNLDIGFHNGYSQKSNETIDTNIGYLHFHWRPFSTYRDLARAKMRPFVDVDDIQALLSYGHPNPNYHLIPYLLMSENEYDAKLEQLYSETKDSSREFVDFYNIMKFLRINPGFIRGLR